ncbi:hypothetical protein GWI33_010718, partial [Rhynchophorus ferrugineus]
QNLRKTEHASIRMCYQTILGVAWAFLGQKSDDIMIYSDDSSQWRIFVLICSLPSACSVVLLCFLPETPKFLITKRRFDNAMMVFQKIYACNTGNNMKRYPVSNEKY